MVPSKSSISAQAMQFACALPEDQFRDRLDGIASNLFAGSREVRELPDGYEFQFPGNAEWVTKVTEFILEEQSCCPFFQFELVFEPNQGPLWLRLRGTDRVKEFVAANMNAVVERSEGVPDLKTGGVKMNEATTRGSPRAIPDREVIRAELEATRSAYHRLVNSLSAADWKRKSGNPAWRVGQLLWHLAWGAGYFPKGVEECRKGKDKTPPAWILNPLNMLITRIGSRGATPQSVLEKYDKAHAAIVACLDGVQDDEWHKGVKPLGAFGAYKTVESVFHSVTLHFREHEADILEGIRRS